MDIKDDFNIDLTHDEELFIGLTLHIHALINRLRYQQVIGSPILDTIKSQYPFIFELSLHIYEIFETILGLKLTESELSYVAAHIAAAIERLGLEYTQNKIEVALISHTSNSYSQLLVSRLHSIYGNNVTIEGPYPAYKWAEIVKGKPSAILTTTNYTKTDPFNSIPVLSISPFFSQSDQYEFDKLIKAIRRNMAYSHKEEAGGNIVGKFEKDFFFPDLNYDTSEQTINFLCDRLEEKEIVPEEFRKLTFEREHLSSTVLANNIAVPHPIKACSYRTVIVAATLKKPIPWGDYKAQLIFLLAVRKGEKEYIKNFFGFVNRLMDDGEIVQSVLKSRNFNDFQSYIKL